MKKKVLLRCLLGAPIGIAITTIVTIIISLILKDGSYHPVMPKLVSDYGNELNAVILQAGLSLVYGAAWAGASVIWEAESWSILKQTVIHMIICCAATFPIAYFTRWMPHNATGLCFISGFSS